MSHNGFGSALTPVDSAPLTIGARLPLAAWPPRQPGAACTYAAGALLVTNVSAGSFRSTLASASVLGFLALLVLLLVAVLVAVIRLPPYQPIPAGADPQDQATPAEPLPAGMYAQGLVPAPGALPGPAPVLPGQARVTGPGRGALPVRVPAQPGQKGYSARHAPGNGPGSDADTLGLPRVSGGPPWGPAPRPPGMG